MFKVVLELVICEFDSGSIVEEGQQNLEVECSIDINHLDFFDCVDAMTNFFQLLCIRLIEGTID